MKAFTFIRRQIMASDPSYSETSRKFNSLGKYHLILLLAVFVLPVRSGAQTCTGTGKTIYVSTFSGNQILKVVDTCPATVTVVYTNTSASPGFLPEQIAVGPDNKIYVCDSIASRIWRIDPGTNAAVKIYDASTATAPNNPHGVEGPSFNSAGDLFMNSRSDSGTPHGIWKIAGPANISDSGPFTPVQVFNNTFFGEGTVFDGANNLDFVDLTDNQVLQSSPPYSMENILPTGTGNLIAPIGIAANPQANAQIGFGANDIFVANSGTSTIPGNINHFSSTGTFVNTYATFTSPDFPAYMQFDPNILFVVTAQDGQGGHGKVWRILPSAAPATPILVVDLNTVFLSDTVTGLLSNKAVGLTVVPQTQTAPPQTTGANATNTFTFNSNTGFQVTHILTFPSDAVIPPGVDQASLMIQSTNTLISNGTVDAPIWPQYTGGGPFATSLLFVKAGDNQTGAGTDVGSLYVDLCFDKNNPTPSDADCPTSASGINVQDIFDIAGNKPDIAPGTTAGMPHFFPLNSGQTSWTASALGTVNPACTNTLGAASSGTNPKPQPPQKCDVSDGQNFILSGDQAGSGGTYHRKGSFGTVYNIQMLETLVSANGTPVNTPGVQGTGITWFNTSSLNLDFKVNPGGCPFPFSMTTCPPASNAGNNFFVPAPVASETYGVDLPTGTAPNTLAQPFADTSVLQQWDFNNNPVSNLADGVHVVTYEAMDNAGIQEQNVQLLHSLPAGSNCPNPYHLNPAPMPPCYSTTLFSAQIGVDTTPPTITITAPLSGAAYALNQAVAASYSCADAGSGVATCAGPVASGANIDTASVGSKTFTVNSTDVAGNSATKSVNYSVGYNICVLYDQTKSVKGGAAYPIKIELCDASGNDVSSSAVVVTATGITLMSTSVGTPEAVGSANPDNNFRFDSTLGTMGIGGYIYNLSTGGLATGTYSLQFTAGSDPTTHTVTFGVK